LSRLSRLCSRRVTLTLVALTLVALFSSSLDAAPLAERWLHPVDIGLHVEQGAVRERSVSERELWQLFAQGTSQLTAKGRARYAEAKRRLAQAVRPPASRRLDPAYRALDEPPFARVHELSSRRVRVFVLHKTGVSRWHHFFRLLDALLVERSPAVDRAFGLPALEGLLGTTYRGVGHGTTFEAAVRLLGDSFDEYLGQSPDFRNIYYPQHNLELVVQAGRVMILHRRRPGWMSLPAAPDGGPRSKVRLHGP